MKEKIKEKMLYILKRMENHISGEDALWMFAMEIREVLKKELKNKEEIKNMKNLFQQIINFLLGRCRYYHECGNPFSRTCYKQDEARTYCGIYKSK